ncbi:ROK family protein [Agrococcus sp. Marseille-Q4369]|nr:ROK family protein [Agrococcus sp. Marseille-Q4369]
MVAPAGDLEPVEAPRAREPRDLLERQVGPLAGEQGEGSRHRVVSARSSWPWSVSLRSILAPPAASLRPTASSTRCTARPSANDGSGGAPAAIARSRSAACAVKVLSQPSTCPGGHHPSSSGWCASVTSTRAGQPSRPEVTVSSLSRSRSSSAHAASSTLTRSGPDGPGRSGWNVRALGEQRTAWPETDDFVLVKVATGIGAGIISGGRLQRGAKGTAGDLAHVRVPGSSAPCR